MTQGQILPAKQKEDFIKLVIEAFYDNPHFKQSSQLLDQLKKEHHKDPAFVRFLEKLKANAKDDKYGTFTLTMEDTPCDIEFRLKRENAYGGPKTENYFDRIDLRIEAAYQYIAQNMDETSREALKKQLEEFSKFIKEKIEKECYLSPSILSALENNDETALAHFEMQHEKALVYLSAFNNYVVEQLSAKDKSKNIKKQLYINETKLMSDKKRPQRITARPITIENENDTTTYYEVNRTTPVTPDRTVSSSKKNEAGVANWLYSITTIYDNDFVELERNELYRSASIIPHDIIRQGKFQAALAADTARRNVLEHIIPALAQKALSDNPQLEDPIEINYEMLTLLSPISKKVDKIGSLDPDYAQYMAIKNALARYDGRTLTIEVDGKPRAVKFNAIYQNYGVNPGRKLSKAADLANQNAYNNVLDRAIATLQTQAKNFEDDLKAFTFEIIKILKEPEFSENELKFLDFINESLNGEGGLYAQMDKNSALLTKEEHEKLLKYNEKESNNIDLTNDEKAEHEALKQKFDYILIKNKQLQKQVNLFQNKMYQIHYNRAVDRQDNILKNIEIFERILPTLEKQASSAQEKELAAHLRAIYEYTKLIKMGNEPFFENDLDVKNSRNYEIQCYIERLNKFSGWIFQETCKSGKDRTNSAVEKQKAKAMISLHEGRLVQSESENPEVKVTERKLFIQGYQQGPGNDICGDNMKPGAQQVDKQDFTSSETAAIKAGKKMAVLQKGLNGLDQLDSKDEAQIRESFLRQQQAAAQASPALQAPSMPQQPSLPKESDKKHEALPPRDTTTSQKQTLEPKEMVGSHRRPYLQDILSRNTVVSQSLENTGKRDSLIGLHKRVNDDKNAEYLTQMHNFSKLKISPKVEDCTPFYATSSSNQTINYSTSKSPSEAQLQAICAFAVKYAIDGAVFNISNANPALKDKMHAFLKDEIEKAGKSNHLSINLSEKTTPSSLRRSSPS